MKRSEAGNVLFLILIAVVLFAALSYVVTSSSRTGGGSLSREKSALMAGEIFNYSLALKVTIERLISSGCQSAQLNPYTTAYLIDTGAVINTANPNAPSDGRCNIFSGPYSGPITYAPKEALGNLLGSPAWTPGHYGIRVMNVKNVGSDSNDVVLLISHLKRDFCMYLVESLKLGTSDIPIETATTNTIQNLNASIADVIGDEEPTLAGKYQFVMRAPTGDAEKCSFYSVLIAR